MKDITENTIKLGNVSSENSQAGMVYDVSGYFPTICACTHGYAIGYICEETEEKHEV